MSHLPASNSEELGLQMYVSQLIITQSPGDFSTWASGTSLAAIK